MIKNLKTFFAGFLACAVLLGSLATVNAAGADVPISAVLTSTISMKLFGKDYTPQDADGTYMKPIVYNGRTYLPVRALADALNIPIDYVNETKTVWIGGIIEDIAVNDTKLYENLNATIVTQDVDKLTTTDGTYKWGITNKEIMKNVNFKCNLLPGGKYKHLTASLFLDDKATGNVTMEFRKETWDGAVIKTVTLQPGVTQEIDIDINGVQKVYVFSEVLNSVSGTVTKLVIGEPTFSNVAAVQDINEDIKEDSIVK